MEMTVYYSPVQSREPPLDCPIETTVRLLSGCTNMYLAHCPIPKARSFGALWKSASGMAGKHTHN